MINFQTYMLNSPTQLPEVGKNKKEKKRKKKDFMPPKGWSKVKLLLPGNWHVAYTQQPVLGWMGGRRANSQSPAPLQVKH